MKEIIQKYSRVLGREFIEVCVARTSQNDPKWALIVRIRLLKSVDEFVGFDQPTYELADSFDNDRIRFVGWFGNLQDVETHAKKLLRKITSEHFNKIADAIVH